MTLGENNIEEYFELCITWAYPQQDYGEETTLHFICFQSGALTFLPSDSVNETLYLLYCTSSVSAQRFRENMLS